MKSSYFLLELIAKIIVFVTFMFLSVSMIVTFSPFLRQNIIYEYIDLDGNKGISEYCTRNMVCNVKEKWVQVKEYKVKDK